MDQYGKVIDDKVLRPFYMITWLKKRLTWHVWLSSHFSLRAFTARSVCGPPTGSTAVAREVTGKRGKKTEVHPRARGFPHNSRVKVTAAPGPLRLSLCLSVCLSVCLPVCLSGPLGELTRREWRERRRSGARSCSWQRTCCWSAGETWTTRMRRGAQRSRGASDTNSTPSRGRGGCSWSVTPPPSLSGSR